MTFKKGLVLFLVIITSVHNVKNDKNSNNGKNVIDPKDMYMGEQFDKKYLVPDDAKPTWKDFDHYATSLKKITDYFVAKPNDTEVNKAVGLYLMKVILKRTIRDLGHKLNESRRKILLDLIQVGETMLDHYIYRVAILYPDWVSLEYRLSKVLQYDTSHVYSLGKLKRGHLQKWILSKGRLNEFLIEMDNATLPRNTYALLLEESVSKYFIAIEDSDLCLARLVTNPEPYNYKKLKPCVPDPFCRQNIQASPSIAYSLSHRAVNQMMYRQNRRCYLKTARDDSYHMDILCSFMYREAVYLARRGFFARDMFLEHVAICGLIGHEEFFRRNWFYKITQWIDFEGCISENPNFEKNRTAAYLTKNYTIDESSLKRLRIDTAKLLAENCHSHPMVLATAVLAHALRYSTAYSA